MKEPNVAYVPVAPCGSMQSILEGVIDTHPDAVVLGVYDSGKTHTDLIPPIKKAKELDIPVFGVRQTLTQDYDVNLALGEEGLNALFEMQPDAISAGLIPIQGYPPEVVEIAEKTKNLFDLYPEYASNAKGSLSISGEATFNHIMDEIRGICRNCTDYESIVSGARKRLSSPGFNERVDEAVLAET